MLTEEGLMHVPGLLSRWVRLGNGAKAHYVTAGETGPTVVLLHGGAAGSSGTALWRTMAPFLGKNGFRVYCPDQPGFGLSDPRKEYWPVNGVNSHVQFVKDFADALCLDRFHLSGNSMGCATASQFILDHPERVTSFVLIAGVIANLLGDRRVVSHETFPAYDGTGDSIRRHIEKVAYRKGPLPDGLIEMRSKSAHIQEKSFAALQAARKRITEDPNIAQKNSGNGRFDRFTIPGIYLHGKQDNLVPVENGSIQEDALPNIQFFYPNEASHLGHIDQPEMFNQVFLEFFRDGQVSRSTAEWAGVSTRRPEIVSLVEQAAPVAG